LFLSSRSRIRITEVGRGRLDTSAPEMLLTSVGIPRGPIYYIAGPPTMVAGARRTLSEVGVDEDDIRTEEFAGY